MPEENFNPISTTEVQVQSGDNDPISFKKAVSGIGSPKNMVKLSVSAINIGLVILIIMGGLSIWNRLFPKKSSQTQTQNSSLTIQSGASVEHINFVSQQKQDEHKKTVGVEGSVSSDDAGVGFVKYINDNWAVVVGAKWKYEKNEDESDVSPTVTLRYDFY